MSFNEEQRAFQEWGVGRAPRNVQILQEFYVLDASIARKCRSPIGVFLIIKFILFVHFLTL